MYEHKIAANGPTGTKCVVLELLPCHGDVVLFWKTMGSLR